jgi:FixJ family two-component response regulator
LRARNEGSEIAQSALSVKAHRHSIMQKLKVGSLAEAVSIAERLGMLAANGNVGLQQ